MPLNIVLKSFMSHTTWQAFMNHGTKKKRGKITKKLIESVRESVCVCERESVCVRERERETESV